MGSVLGSMARKDRGTAPVLPTLQSPVDQTGFFQNISAGFTQAKAGPHSTQNASAIYESRYYDQIRAALKAEGEQATDMVPSLVLKTSPFYHPVPGEQDLPDGRVLIPVKRDFSNPYSEGPSLTRDVNPIANLYMGGDSAEINGMWQAVQRVRQRKPDFLKGLADPQAVAALAAKQRATDLAHAQAVTSRANVAGDIGGFIGGAAGSIASADPEAFLGGFTGSGAAGKSIARQVVRRAVNDAGVNAAAGVIAVPGQMADANRMGQPMTAMDAVKSVGQNALAGAILGTAHVVIPEGAKAVGSVASTVGGKIAENLPAPIRDPVVAASIRAGTVKDRDLLHEFQKAHNPYSVVDTSTPEERAAAHVVTRDVETQEQSPLQPQHVAQHQNNLSAVASALGVDLTPPDAPTTAPIQTATVRDHSETASAPRRPASFVEGINHAEGSTRNPRSSADGYGNFLDSTWLEVAPKVTNTAGMSREQILGLRHDKGIASAATQFYASQNGRFLRSHGEEDSPGNLSLSHFLGAGAALKVLKADPSTPVERLLPANVIEANHEVLRGKSADEVIAWAHKRIGATVDHPPARPDAVPDEGFDYSSPAPYTVEQLRPDELPPTSAAAPTDEPFNPNLAQHLLLWEREDGTRELIDGGKRLAHARSQEDQGITLPSVVLREKDGISEEVAMLVGKLKNVNLGTTSLEEAAGVLADIPEIAGALRNPEFRQQIATIAQLPYDDFGAAINGDWSEVGNGYHAMRREDGDGYVMGPTGAQKRVVGPLTREKVASAIRTMEAERRQVQPTEADAFDKSPARALLDLSDEDFASLAGRMGVKFKVGGKRPVERVMSQPISEVRTAYHGAVTEALARGNADGGRARQPSRPEGRDLSAEAPDGNLPSGSEPSLFDRAITARDAAERFSDPVGPEAKAHTDLLEHDLRPPKEEPTPAGEEPKAPPVADDVHLFDLPATGFRLSEEGDKPISLAQALNEADADEAAAKALRDCL